MKKVFAFILVLCMVLSCVPAFAAGEGCQCTSGDYTVTPNTGAKAGTHWFRCNNEDCGEYRWVNGKTEEKCNYEENGQCTKCGYQCPHTNKELKSDGINSDHSYVCEACGFDFKGYEQCTDANGTIPNDLGTFGGSRTCTKCGYTYTSTCAHTNVEFRLGFDPYCELNNEGKETFKAGRADGIYCVDCEYYVEGGEEIPATGKHTNLTVSVVQEATCKREGLKYVECKDCGFKGYVFIPIDDAHNYVNVGIVKGCDDCENNKPSCTSEGKEHYVCSICGNETHKNGKKLEHSYKTVYVNGTYANGEFTPNTESSTVSCEQAVASCQKCSVCNEQMPNTDYVVISTGEKHEYTVYKYVAPTCTSEGGTKLFCENEGCEVWKWDVKEDKLSKNGKHAKGVRIDVVEKTCTVDGEYYYTCTKCAAHLDANGEELDKGTITDAAVGHTNAGDPASCKDKNLSNHVNSGWTYVAATCGENGYWESYCTECDGNYRKVSFADKCDVCKADASKHKWVMGDIVTEAVCGVKDGTAQTVCSVCGTIAKHTGSASNCPCQGLKDVLKHDSLENIAGKDILWKISKDHDYQVTDATFQKPTCKANGYGYVICSRCGESKWFEKDAKNLPAALKKISHTNKKVEKVFVEETCTKNAHYDVYCSECGVFLQEDKFENIKIDKEAAEYTHNWLIVGKATLCGYNTALQYECGKCGETKIEGVKGSENSKDHEWSKGTFSLANDIDEYAWQPKVTCTTDGYFVKKACLVCGLVENDEIVQVPAQHLGKENDNDKHTEANCVEPAYDYYECTVCKESWKVASANSTKIENPAAGTVTDGKVADKGGHKDWTVIEYITKETCTNDGIGYYGCPYCGAHDDNAKLVNRSHTWSDELIIDKAPTCSTPGLGHKVCSICGYEATNANGSEAYGVEIPKTGKCTFGLNIVNAENCEDNGYITWSCLVCGAADPNVVKAGYTYKNEVNIKLNGQYVTVTNGSASYTVDKYVDKPDGSYGTNGKINVTIKNIVEILPNGVHDWGTPEMHEATCTEKGGLHRVCKVCGTDKYCGPVDGGISALGHDVVCTVSPENCYMDGQKVYSCLRCGEILYTDTIKTEGHKMVVSSNKADSVAPTCSTKGYDLYVCQNDGCGYSYKNVLSYNSNNHKYVIDTVIREATCTRGGSAVAHCEYCDKVNNKIITLDAGHKWEVIGVKQAATCTNKGVDYVKCSVCGATGTQVSKALGHTMVTEAVEADCEHTAGIKTYCSVCSYMTKFVKTGSEKLGHKWGDKVYVAATCEEDAHYESTCARCGKVAVTKIVKNEPKYQAKLEHKGSKLVETVKPTCTERGYDVRYCSLCNSEYKTNYTSADVTNGHDWVITYTYGNAEINCGNYGYAKVKCSICGMETQKYLKPEHSYTDNIITDDIVYKVCTVCGDIKSIWVNSNFTGFKGCGTITIVNGEKVITGTHKGLVVKASKAATCTEAGELGHIECTVCGTVVRVGGVVPAHTTKEVAAVEATCTTEGSTAGTFCLVCNKYVVAPQKIAAKGHKWVEVPAQEATATKPGYTAGTQCENCKEWKEGHEETPVKAASLKRTAVLRKTAELLGERVALLNTDDAISITGELVNGFYPVSSADGTGYIHNSYIAVA